MLLHWREKTPVRWCKSHREDREIEIEVEELTEVRGGGREHGEAAEWRRRGTNKTQREPDSRGVLKCAPARHTAALVSKLRMSCWSLPPASSHSLFTPPPPPSRSPLAARLSADLSDSEKRCVEEETKAPACSVILEGVWRLTQADEGSISCEPKQTVPSAGGGGGLELRRSDKVDYTGDWGHRGEEGCSNKDQIGDANSFLSCDTF